MQEHAHKKKAEPSDSASGVLNLLGHDSLELLNNFLFRCSGAKRHHNDDDGGKDECGEQLVYGEDAAQRSNSKLPHEYHHSTGEHTGDGAPLVAALPEQGEEHYGAEGGAKAGKNFKECIN